MNGKFEVWKLRVKIIVKRVCVQGLGFVGSAMAIAVSLAKDINGFPLYDVVGVDLPTVDGNKRIDAINSGEFLFDVGDIGLKNALINSVRNNNIRATSDEKVYSSADIVVIDVQFDVDYLGREPKLEFSGFSDAIRVVAKYIKRGALIVVETTVPPGTCEKIVVPIIKKELSERGMNINDVKVSHSYERVMPGNNYLDSIINYWRVFSGYTEGAADACESFLKTIINVDKYPLTRLSSTVESELAKLLENTYRAANIAFIDEWTKFAEKAGVDLYSIIDAIAVRDTHSNIMRPGLGVGGYCLTKDPALTPLSARQLFHQNGEFPFSNMAIDVNNNMPLHVVGRIEENVKEMTGKKVLLCGVSYRQDVGDSRYSPSETLVKELINRGCVVTSHDPYLLFWDELGIMLEKKLPDPNDFDVVILAVAHMQYKKIDYSSWITKKEVLLMDANNVMTKMQRESARANRVRCESIGRGNGL